jgi:hypothetical protein
MLAIMFYISGLARRKNSKKGTGRSLGSKAELKEIFSSM